MFNGIWPEPTNKRFNSAYLQIKYLIFRKIHSNTFWLDKTFIFSSQVTMMFQKKRFFENKKIRVRFSIVDFPAKPAKQKKQVALKKSLRLHTRGTPAATRKPKNASKRLWIGPKHNSVHFESLCWCLPIDRWSCVHPVYAGKRLLW